jgi:hypothetical protein
MSRFSCILPTLRGLPIRGTWHSTFDPVTPRIPPRDLSGDNYIAMLGNGVGPRVDVLLRCNNQPKGLENRTADPLFILTVPPLNTTAGLDDGYFEFSTGDAIAITRRSPDELRRYFYGSDDDPLCYFFSLPWGPVAFQAGAGVTINAPGKTLVLNSDRGEAQITMVSANTWEASASSDLTDA